MAHSSDKQTSTQLRLARHGVAMLLLALANPSIYFASDKLQTWLSSWVLAIISATVIYALYALFFTCRAKSAWPGSAISLAWIFLGLMIAGSWMTYRDARQTGVAAKATPPTSMESTSANPFANPDYGKDLLPSKPEN